MLFFKTFFLSMIIYCKGNFSGTRQAGKQGVWRKFPSHSLNRDCAAYINQICSLKEARRALKDSKYIRAA